MANSPVLTRRPLSGASRDQALFVAPVELEFLLRAIDLRTNIFLSGTPGSGKTTLARHVAERRPGVEIVQAERAATLDDLILNLVEAISSDAGRDRSAVRGSEWDIGLLLDALRVNTSNPSPIEVIVLDGATEEQVRFLFGRYRDALWEAEITWLVTSRSGRPATPADAFFDHVVELQPWTLEALKRMAMQRLGDDYPAGLDEVLNGIAPATPLVAITAIQAFFLAPEPSEFVRNFHAERAVLEELPDRLRDLYRAIETLGPVSASDEELLNAVGVSRPRLTSGLRELEEQRLVTAQRDGKKKLYRTIANVALAAVSAAAVIR